jgi:GNAT superfamily N-acetyltransferase
LSGRLSKRSRLLHYLAPVQTVSEQMLRRLAAIDHECHEALGAFDEGELIAVAHYFRYETDPARAEISVEVADSHQRRGIGQRLMNDLARLARERGITEFNATASLENRGVLAMVHNSQWPSQVRRSGPELDIAVTLPEPRVEAVGQALAAALRRR